MASRSFNAAAQAVARTVIPVPDISVLRRPSNDVHAVAVFRALKLGDMLCAVPALRAVRAGLPQARITLVGLPWANSFVERFAHYVDDFAAFPGSPGLPEQEPDEAALPDFFAHMRGQKYDLAIQMHGSGTLTNGIVADFNARITAGFGSRTVETADSHFVTYPDSGLEADRLLKLTDALGFPSRGNQLEFPLEPADFLELRHDMGGRPELRNYAIVHAGASSADRRWDTDSFARVADALARDGMTVVLTGTAEERSLASDVAARMTELSFNLAGATSLGALAVLVDGARVVVANDTGISHLAAARRTPSVIVFTGSDPRRWAPADRDLHRVVVPARGRPVETAIAHARALVSRAATSHRSSRPAA
jgi:ADP-heptose:LPS heptosyltransferase